jgi:hypothetical protein
MIILRQTTKQHNPHAINQLLHAAGLRPAVFVSDDRTEFHFEGVDDPADEKPGDRKQRVLASEAKAQQIISAYTFVEPDAAPGLDELYIAMEGAKTFNEFKDAMLAYERGKHPERKKSAARVAEKKQQGK